MRLAVEIKDGKFIYEYKVGASSHHGESELCADSLVYFANLLNTCHSTTKFEHRKWELNSLAKELAHKFKEGNNEPGQ